jgi:hypothetical protein
MPFNWRTGKPVLCIPGFGILDEAFTAIVAQAIEKQGIAVRAESRDALSVARAFTLDTTGVELVCVCYLAAATPAQIRYSLRRLRRTAVDTFILVVVAGTVDMDEKDPLSIGRAGKSYSSIAYQNHYENQIDRGRV